ncbi:smc4, partial [Symbiodinium microadriaticum]
MGLKDTLVTHDWDLATRVAYEGDRVKWRIVTTTGNLIDTSGSMTGGGKVARSGGMSSQSAQVPSEAIITQEHIDRLDVTVSQLQGELSKCRADIAATEKELKETEQEVKKAAVQTEKNSVQKLRVLGEYHDLAGRVASFRTSCELTEDEKQSMGQMGAQLTDVIHRMEELCPDRIALQDRVHSLRQQILDVGGPKLKRAHSKVDSVNSEYDACRSRLCAAEVSLTSTAKQATKAGNAREKADAELVKSQEKWEALVEEQREMESEAEKVLLAQEAAKAAAQLKEEELTDIRAEFKRLDEVKMTVQGVKVDLANN